MDMPGMPGMMGWWMVLWGLLGLAVLVLVVVLIVRLVSPPQARAGQGATREAENADPAEEELRRRYAAGEITHEEYRERRANLRRE